MAALLGPSVQHLKAVCHATPHVGGGGLSLWLFSGSNFPDTSLEMGSL